MMHDADEGMRELIRAALQWPAEKFPLPFVCRKGATNIDQCFEKRCEGCYCSSFEIWRGGAPSRSDEPCALHPRLEPFRREHTAFDCEAIRSYTRERCWYCILDEQHRLHKKEAAENV